MTSHNRRLGLAAKVLMLLAVSSLVLVVSPATAAKVSKIYSVSMTAVEGSEPGTVLLEFTISNNSQGAAVLGSANVTAPVEIPLLGSPTITDVSADKTWTATRAGQVVRLRAVGDMMKLSPGEHITFEIEADISDTDPGVYTFVTAAKASRDFTGSSSFGRLGPNPQLALCDSASSCSASTGNVNNPPPDHEIGQFSLDECFGTCFISIGETAGDFCSTSPNPPNTPCKAPFVPQFTVDPNYTGYATFILACDATDCPPVPDPCESICTLDVEEGDDYPIFYTDTNAPTNSEQFVETLPECDNPEFPENTPCVLDQGRISEGAGAGDLQATIKLFFFSPCEEFCEGGGVDPRTGW